jgi:hypothetical protein
MMVKPTRFTTVANPVSIGCLLVLIANVGILQTNHIDEGQYHYLSPSSVWY